MARVRTKSWEALGDGWYEEHSFFGLRVYKRHLSQAWSPLMREHEIERGVRFGPRRFGWTVVFKEFLDGAEPRIVKGPY